MAHATITNTTKPEYIRPEGVTLHLSPEEAHVLRSVMASIGGCPHTTLRVYTDAIGRALADVGYDYISCAFHGDLRAQPLDQIHDDKFGCARRIL